MLNIFPQIQISDNDNNILEILSFNQILGFIRNWKYVHKEIEFYIFLEWKGKE